MEGDQELGGGGWVGGRGGVCGGCRHAAFLIVSQGFSKKVLKGHATPSAEYVMLTAQHEHLLPPEDVLGRRRAWKTRRREKLKMNDLGFT